MSDLSWTDYGRELAPTPESWGENDFSNLTERALQIEVLPPAPVPEEILSPSPVPNPGPEDRMTQVPRRLGTPAGDTSWVFPRPSGAGSGRLVDRGYPGGPAPESYRR